MIEGVDYSFARPDPACLKRNGKHFAVRYTSIGDSQKNMTPAEVIRLADAGLAVATVHQEGTGDLLQGREFGVSSATWARRHADPCGMPEDRPVYFALDQDPRALTAAQWDRCKAFLDGAASVLGRPNVGVYGGFKAIETLVPRWAPWGWQTFAWSAGQLSGNAALFQYRNGVSLCGGLVDFTRGLRDDYGQWGDEMNTAEFKEALRDEFELVSGRTREALKSTSLWGAQQAISPMLNDETKVLAAIAAVTGLVGESKAAILGALAAMNLDLSDEQIARLAVAIGFTPEEIAEAVRFRLAGALEA